jgi:peptidoglycan/xylan/chitin deacetylase (PgdA/CDA1 family)
MNILKFRLFFILFAVYLILPAYGMADTLVSDAVTFSPNEESYAAEKTESDYTETFLSADKEHFVPAHLKGLLSKTNRIVLTFDDGPHPNATPHILKILKKYNVRAVFFVLGLQVEKYPELVKMIHDDGHIIGNHTYGHKRLPDLSEEQMRAEITRTGNLVASITGKKPTLLRPPYGTGAKNRTLQKIAAEEKLKFFLWTVDSKDWKNKNAKAVLTSVEKQLGIGKKNRVGGAVLLHDIYSTTANALEYIIKSAFASDYIFIDPYEMNLTNQELIASRMKNDYKSFDPALSGNELLVTMLTKEKKEIKTLDIIRAHRQGNLMLFLALNK